MVVALMILLTLLAFVLLWPRLRVSRKRDIRRQLGDNMRTLLAMVAVLFLPASLLLRRQEWMVSWIVPAVGLGLWGFFLVVYRDNQVVPAETLRPRADSRSSIPSSTVNEATIGDGGACKISS